MKKLLTALILGFACHSHAQIEMAKETKSDSLIIKVKNELPVPIRLIISDSLDSKMISLNDSAYHRVLGLFLPSENDTSKVLSPYSFTVRIGDGTARHKTGYRYALPFPMGRSYKLIQGFNGSFSHTKQRSRYALDFRMPKGDTVCAAREGLVVWTEGKHGDGGKDPALINKANRVIIMHDDGTLGLYLHLVKNGILVRIGQEVNRGQPIGLSGNSGYSTEPHLHFAVLEDITSVPIRFKQLPRNLKEGRTYRAKH